MVRIVPSTGARGFDAILVAAVTMAAGAWAFGWPTTSQDEFSLLIYPDLIAQGRVPNRDFFTPYGPATYWPLTGVYTLTGGPSVLAARAAGLAYHVLLAIGIWAVTCRRGRWLSVGAGALSGVLSAGLLLVPYGWLLALSAVVWSMALAERGRWLLAGIFAAVACTVRPEFVVVVAAVYAGQLRNIRAVRRFLFGLALGSIPLAFHLFLAGDSLVKNVFADRVGADTRLAFPPESFDLRIGLTLVGIAALSLVLFAVLYRRPKSVAMALLAVSILPQALQRSDREHLLFVAVVIMPLAAAELFFFAGQRRFARLWSSRAQSRSAVIVCGAMILLGLCFSVVAPRGQLLHVGGRSVFAADESIGQQLRASVDSIESHLGTGDTLFVGTHDMSRSAITPTYLYYLMPSRVPDAYYLEFAPGVTERSRSPLLQDVKKADVLALSRFTASQREVLFPYLRQGSTAVDRYVARNFCVRGQVAGFGVFPDIGIYEACS